MQGFAELYYINILQADRFDIFGVSGPEESCFQSVYNAWQHPWQTAFIFKQTNTVHLSSV